MEPKLVVVIPAYNEEATVGDVVRSVQKHFMITDLACLNPEVLVVDDGSKDGTYEKACQAGAVVFRHFINCGLGAALKTGIRAALLRGATMVVTFDADGQHDARDIARVVHPVLTGEADVVIGSRLMNPQGMPPDRRLINWGANLFTWMLFRVWVTDSQSGLRALSLRAAQNMHIRTNRMEVSSEIVAEAGRLNLRLVEVPIQAIYTSYSRKKGQTNWNSLQILSKLFLRVAR